MKLKKSYYLNDSHYFTIGFCNYWNLASNIGVLVEEDKSGKCKFIHSWIILTDGIYLDAKGIFRSLDERSDDFKLNYTPVVYQNLSIQRFIEVLTTCNKSYKDKNKKETIDKLVENLTFVILIGSPDDYSAYVYNGIKYNGIALKFVAYGQIVHTASSKIMIDFDLFKQKYVSFLGYCLKNVDFIEMMELED